jgi:hypothetical protein
MTTEYEKFADGAKNSEITNLEVRATFSEGAVLHVEFGPGFSAAHLPLNDAREITSESTEIDDGQIMVGFRYEGRIGARDDEITGVRGLKLIQGEHERELENDPMEQSVTICDYLELSEGWVNETMHPKRHLANPVGENVRFFAWEPDTDD